MVTAMLSHAQWTIKACPISSTFLGDYHTYYTYFCMDIYSVPGIERAKDSKGLVKVTMKYFWSVAAVQFFLHRHFLNTDDRSMEISFHAMLFVPSHFNFLYCNNTIDTSACNKAPIYILDCSIAKQGIISALPAFTAQNIS